MAHRVDFDNIELHLVRVLKTLITERSVSRTAMHLQCSQPAVSSQLKRLRELTGDPLLVRSGNSMMPTAAALRFLKREAPTARLELLPLSGAFDYRRSLAAGEIDLVIGNWLQPPEELHLGKLTSDEMVCLVAENHPVVKIAGSRAWNLERYLQCEHIAPTPLHAHAAGVIEDHLESSVQRDIMVRSAHFGLIPLMVAHSLLVMTTGRRFCSRYIDVLPVRIVRCPMPFPPLNYYQFWHELSHGSVAGRWLREQVRDVACNLAGHGVLRRSAGAAA
ncbi:MAG: LysR family transcriptional regulator [Pseudomonadota bacterium]|nr:LysR family transcriptional regulator [Pseudomonadota bacterium]